MHFRKIKYPFLIFASLFQNPWKSISNLKCIFFKLAFFGYRFKLGFYFLLYVANKLKREVKIFVANNSLLNKKSNN
jgi:hypothetical protein